MNQPQTLSDEEIKRRTQEDRYIQEAKKAYEWVARAKAVAEARKERAKAEQTKQDNI